MRWPGQRAPLNRTGQWGQSAPTTSGAQAGCAPSRQSWLQDPRALIFVVFGVLWLVTAASAMPTRQERVHQQFNVPQGWRRSFWELCPPGYHVSEDGKNCTSCIHGVDFTIYWNVLPSCLPCTTCKSGEEEKTPCTATADTRCECKPGTFREENSPEFCQKCHTRCPDGMVMATPCTPSSDLKCMDQESGNSELVVGIAVPCSILLLAVVIACLVCKCKVQGYGLDPKCMDKVLFWRSHPSRGPGAQDNKLMCGDSLSTLLTKKEQEDQEQEKPADVTVQSSREAEHLLEPAAAEGSQVRRRLLVPADGGDPTECLKQCFDDFSPIVPYDSWNKLMRKMGLTQNEILQIRNHARNPGDALYEMLETWVCRRGREASVNDLLDALEALGQRYAKQEIEDKLVSSRKFVFKEGEASAAVS
uniref:Tumor necrosis factor receptor superfamily member 10A-like n=1 Tax=Sus scrofa TaxID=9823 RepID=A0A4X1VE86_PIG